MYDAARFIYTPYTNEAPTVFSSAMPLATKQMRPATMVDQTITETEWIIYRVTCIPSGRSYIGLTTLGDEARWNEHVRSARLNKKRGAFQRAIKKYGPSAFAREVLYVATSEREAVAVERGLIAQYGTLVPSGYNITVGGETYKGSPGVKGARFVSEKHREHLRRLAAAMKGKPRKRESVEKGRAKLMGHFVSEETRRKNGNGRRGKAMPESAKAAIRAKNLLWKPNDEIKAKIAAAQRAAWADPAKRAARLATHVSRRRIKQEAD